MERSRDTICVIESRCFVNVDAIANRVQGESSNSNVLRTREDVEVVSENNFLEYNESNVSG